MFKRLILIACAGAACVAAEPARGLAPTTVAASGEVPWTLSFTTSVRGKDRQFVEVGGKTYLLVTLDEIATGTLDDQEIALTGKLRRLPGDQFGLYRVDALTIAATGNTLAGKLDGDNVHLAGTLRAGDAQRTFTVVVAAAAPSDAQLLQSRLAGIQDDEWDRRLGVVTWCREQARTAGNVDSWTATADALLGRIITDMSSKAGERKDAVLVTRAIDLALNQVKDNGLAARLASPLWIREHGGAPADAISRRMRGLGYALYKDAWMPRPQAAEREFEDRFAALAWKDAEGFYQLGRWADDNAEALPRARERSWRCYQAGRQADPSHAGIARELGLKAQAAAMAGAAAAKDAIDFIDPENRVQVPAPAGWKRGKPHGEDTTWIDPESDTALIAIRVLRPPVDPDAAWQLLDGEARARNAFTEVGQSVSGEGGHQQHLLRSTWMEGEQSRFALVVLVPLGDGQPAVVLEGRGLPADQQRLDLAVTAAANGATMLDAAPKTP